jgi:GTPase
MQIEAKEKPLYAVVAAVQLPSVSDFEFEASLTELRELAKTLGFTVTRTFTQKRSSFDSTAYLGVGKRQEIRHFVNSEAGDEDESDLDSGNPLHRLATFVEVGNDGEAMVSPHPIDVLFVDHEISPSQARNLENEVGCQVMDRTMVILEIFHRNARSPAARAQVEIARLGYLAPRLREAAKLAGPQGGSAAASAAAAPANRTPNWTSARSATASPNCRRKSAMDADRKTQRARRQAHQGLASVALVGYTNAGKSTLMRALTGSEVLVANKLFATLDTTVRTLHPESVPRVLVSDTVGFIKNLPHDLVASFKSTLEEALDASLLLHVIDASDPGFERQIEATEVVLNEIGAQDVPRLRIFNKIDHVGDAAAQAEREAALRARYPDCIVMSARRPDDVAKLHKAILAFFQKDLVEAELFLPWSAQQLRGCEIFARCEVLEERFRRRGRLRSSACAASRNQLHCPPNSKAGHY